MAKPIFTVSDAPLPMLVCPGCDRLLKEQGVPHPIMDVHCNVIGSHPVCVGCRDRLIEVDLPLQARCDTNVLAWLVMDRVARRVKGNV